MKLKTAEMGDVEVFVIYAPKGKWEKPWDTLQGTEFGKLLTEMPKETIDHVLKGWSSPFVKTLGLPPVGSLRKLPLAARQCAVRRKCPIYAPQDCFPESRRLPFCYEPDGVPKEARESAVELIRYWREGVYVLVQVED
jgi:hypothetical protein